MVQLTIVQEKTAQRRLTMPSLKPQLISLLNNQRIDWYGKMFFKPDGSLDINKNPPPINFYAIPVPALSKQSEEYQSLLPAISQLEQLLIPALSHEVLFQLKALSGFCSLINRNATDFELMLRQYLEDLTEYPLDLICEACRRYRNDPAPKNDYFPRPGRLITLIKNELHIRKQQLTRLQMLLDKADNHPPTECKSHD